MWLKEAVGEMPMQIGYLTLNLWLSLSVLTFTSVEWENAYHCHRIVWCESVFAHDERLYKCDSNFSLLLSTQQVVNAWRINPGHFPDCVTKAQHLCNREGLQKSGALPVSGHAGITRCADMERGVDTDGDKHRHRQDAYHYLALTRSKHTFLPR
jgi:hypothetical protein